MSVRTLAIGDDPAAVVRDGGDGGDEAVTLVIAAGRSPLDLALARAAVAPLAQAEAPRRINAVVAADGADPHAVAAAVAFLDAATAVTGQILEVG